MESHTEQGQQNSRKQNQNQTNKQIKSNKTRKNKKKENIKPTFGAYKIDIANAVSFQVICYVYAKKKESVTASFMF